MPFYRLVRPITLAFRLGDGPWRSQKPLLLKSHFHGRLQRRRSPVPASQWSGPGPGPLFPQRAEAWRG